MAYACTLGFHKNIADQLPQAFQGHMPDRELLRPCFTYIPNRERRRDDDMSMSEEEERKNTDTLDPETRADVDAIMECIQQKGEVSEQLLATLKTVKCSTEVQRAILVELLLMKYILSFEHTLHYIRRVRAVMEQLFDSDESQREALATILKAYNLDDLATQDYDNDVVNIYQVRNKVVHLVLKLVDLGLFRASALVPYCLDKIKGHLATNADLAKLDQLPHAA